jgi:hypothetical protein
LFFLWIIPESAKVKNNYQSIVVASEEKSLKGVTIKTPGYTQIFLSCETVSDISDLLVISPTTSPIHPSVLLAS